MSINFFYIFFIVNFIFFVPDSFVFASDNSKDSLLLRIERLEEVINKQQELLESLKCELNEQKEMDEKAKLEQRKEIGELKAKIENEESDVSIIALRKPKKFKVTGRVQFRYQAINDNNDDLSIVTGQKPFDSFGNDGFSIRRMRLNFFGEINERWGWHVQISGDGQDNEDNISSDTPDYRLIKDDVGIKLQDALISYHLNPYFNIVFGQFKCRFSPSYLTSGPSLPLCERPLVIDKLARTREIGISIESKTEGTWDGRDYYKKPSETPFYYALGIYNGNKFNRMRNDNENMMYTAMIMLRPLHGFRLGASYAYDEIGTEYETTVLGDPELAKFLVSEGGRIKWEEYYAYKGKNRKIGDKLDIWDVNCALDLGRLHLQFEYISQDGNSTSRAYGYGLQGQFDVIDLLNSLKILRNWSLWEAVKGVQIVFRYDEFDPNTDMDNSFDSRWYTAGWNFFIHDPHLKWQLNYTKRNEMHGKEMDNDILYSHFQLLF
ncbi:MAG: porin [Thermodesulfobacteriota bacterium]|nr:porin [Thermodesulfobacteriota bacterium]